MSTVAAILKSGDIPATLGWYRAAGFTVRRSEPTFCEVSRAGLDLRFLSGDTPWAGPSALTGCVYVHVPDVDAVADDIRGAIDAEWGVEDRDWGSRELVLRDPDGYVITFTAPGHPASMTTPCWCCAGEFTEPDLVRLGDRPEVTICLDCARYVHRRASARRDEQRWTPFSAVRAGVQRVRDLVIRNGWHERGPLGAFLRRLDRFLP